MEGLALAHVLEGYGDSWQSLDTSGITSESNLYDGTGHGVTGADVEQDLQGAAAEGDPCGHREETGFIDDGQDNACDGARDEGLDEAYQYVERHYPDAE